MRSYNIATATATLTLSTKVGHLEPVEFYTVDYEVPVIGKLKVNHRL